MDRSGARNWFGMDLAWCRRRRAPKREHNKARGWKSVESSMENRRCMQAALCLVHATSTQLAGARRCTLHARPMAIQLCTQPNKSSLSAAKFFSSISNLHKYLPSSTFAFNLPHKHLHPYYKAPVRNLISKRLQSHLQA